MFGQPVSCHFPCCWVSVVAEVHLASAGDVLQNGLVQVTLKFSTKDLFADPGFSVV